MNKENLKNKTWYRAVKVLFVLSFLLAQGFVLLITYSIVGDRVVYTLPIKGNEHIVIYKNIIPEVGETISAEEFQNLPKGKNTKVKFDGAPTATDIKEVAGKYNLSTIDYRVFGKEQVIANIEAMENQGASQWEVQEYLDSRGKPDNFAGFWADKTDIYSQNKYSPIAKVIYLILSFLVVSVVFWLIARIFFYIALGEKFFSLKRKGNQ